MTARQNAPDRAETARHGANGIASVSDTVKTGNPGFRALDEHSNCEPGSPLMCAECRHAWGRAQEYRGGRPRKVRCVRGHLKIPENIGANYSCLPCKRAREQRAEIKWRRA